MPSNIEKIKNLSQVEGGRSNAAIFFTSGQKFVIKSLQKAEKNIFLMILKDYNLRIRDPDCKLVRIFAMFCVKPFDLDFIVMENIIFEREKAVIFDVKGSSLDRHVKGIVNYSEYPYGRVLKDSNLFESGYKFNFDSFMQCKILNSLSKDFAFLEKYEIMDYSVMLAIYQKKLDTKSRYYVEGPEQSYAIGVIDYFQKYNMQKKSERFFKKIFHRRIEISSENPQLYKKRILNSLQTLLTESE